MDTLLRAISQYPNGTNLIVEWHDGCTVLGSIDTIYETNNELEPDDEAYQEFYACLLHVIEILGHSNEKEYFAEGDLIEVSMQKSPARVCLQDNSIIWGQK